MKLKGYIARLEELEKAYGNLDVVYACDEEGNRFTYVQFSPTTGKFDRGEFQNDTKNPNCVCVN